MRDDRDTRQVLTNISSQFDICITAPIVKADSEHALISSMRWSERKSVTGAYYVLQSRLNAHNGSLSQWIDVPLVVSS